MANTDTIAAAQANLHASHLGAVRTFSFPGDGKPVRTVTLDSGEPGFVGKDVAERLGYTDTAQAVRQHCRGVLIQQPIPDALGRMQPTRVLTEPDVLRLIISSTLPAAQEFERWVFEEVLPSLRRTGSYAMPAAAPAVRSSSDDIAVLNALADALRLSESARLGMLRKGMTIVAPHLLPAVPVYATDAPAGAVPAIGSEPTASLTELLKEHGTGVSTQKMNKLLVEAGMLERRTRPSSRGGEKSFLSITAKGAAYGKNITSPSSPNETQPHWFIGRFAALMAAVGAAGLFRSAA